MEDKNNLLAKWLAGELSDSEKKQFESENDLSDLESALDIVDKMEYPNFDQHGAWNEVKKNLKPKAKIISFSFLLKVASIILFVGGVSFWFFANQNFSVSTQFAETKTIILPDQSEIVLNQNSTISYDKENWDKKRVVNIEGEAFFKVAKGSIFVVKSSNGLVQVLGTKFNVYDRKNILRVACYEGKVKIYDEVSNYSREIKISESVYLVDHKQVFRIFEDMKDIPSWISKKMKVASHPVSELLTYLGAEFKVEFDMSNIDKEKRYTGPVDLTDINKAVKLLSQSMSWNYEMTKDGKKIILTDK